MSHFYDEHGNPAYTVLNKKGEEKPTTLREARLFNYWPSVTTVMQMAASPGLDMYRQQQLCQAAWDEVRKLDMPYDRWKRRVVTQSKKHAEGAASRGTEIHDALEDFYKSRISQQNPTFREELAYLILPVIEFLDKEFPSSRWVAEASFCSPLGFGGKVDLHDPVNNIVLDFKTKDTDDIKKMIAYDQHHMQSAAYAVGLSMPGASRFNLFISTKVPGLLNLTESTDFSREWGMFQSLLTYWQLSNKYSPKRAENA